MALVDNFLDCPLFSLSPRSVNDRLNCNRPVIESSLTVSLCMVTTSLDDLLRRSGVDRCNTAGNAVRLFCCLLVVIFLPAAEGN